MILYGISLGRECPCFARKKRRTRKATEVTEKKEILSIARPGCLCWLSAAKRFEHSR
jgi:hypothetical protein